MTTWIDRQDPEMVRAAMAELAAGNDLAWRVAQARGGAAYAVWLALVDEHTARLFAVYRDGDWDWQAAYDRGVSPRTAAISAYADTHAPVSALPLPAPRPGCVPAGPEAG
jgi:hypothetical protein